MKKIALDIPKPEFISSIPKPEFVQTDHSENKKPILFEDKMNILPHKQQYFSSGQLQNVIEMQKAIIEFTNNIGTHPIATSTPSPQETGSDAFGNFLVQNYINKIKPVGKTQINAPGRTQEQAENIQTENTNLRALVRTMKSIGVGGTQRPDGVWGNLTNNALKNIYAFVAGFIQLEKDMGNKNADTDEKNIETFRSLLKPDAKDYTNEEKNKLAPQITKLINTFIISYLNFEKNVLTKHKDFIQDQIPATITIGGNKSSINDKEKEVFQNIKNKEIPSLTLNGKPVPFASLENKQALEDFIKQSGSKDDVKKILNDFQAQLSASQANLQGTGF